MPSLLTIPQELRDQIYEEVLAGQNGELHYRTYYGVNTNTVVFCGRAHQEPFEFSKSCMPQEKRDEHHNQLRFVCRQLYKETSGLEFKHNTVVFHGDEPALARSFLHAAQVEYIKKNMDQFREVKLYCANGVGHFHTWYRYPLKSLHDTPEDLVRLAQLCRQNQMMQVQYTLADFRFDMSAPFEFGMTPPFTNDIILGDRTSPPCFALAIFFVMALRGKDLSFLLPLKPDVAELLISKARSFGNSKTPATTSDSSAEQTTSSTEQATFYEKISTPNLRFWPLLRRVYRKNGSLYRELLVRESSKMPEGSLQRMRDECALDWARNGF